MNIPLRIVTKEEKEAFPDHFWRLPEYWGCMWRWPEADVDGIEAWYIILPNNAGGWCTTDKASGSGVRWTVTGEPPNISVHPSINAVGSWHGWIRNGVMEE